MLLSSIASEIHWRPGFGDPDAVGWLITAGYGLAAALCVVCARRLGQGSDSTNSGASPRFWMGLALVMALLGLNKQLDLQTLLVDMGRAVSQHGGWYERRRPLKVAFVVFLGAGGLLALAFAVRWIRRHARDSTLLVAGLGAILAYVVIRATPLHSAETGAHSPFWPVEFAGVLLVAVAAARSGRAVPPPTG